MFGKKQDNSINPPPSSKLSNAREVLRLWEVRGGGGQEVTLRPDAFADKNGRVDPVAWGMALVDIAGHVATAYKETLGADPSIVLQRIRSGFDAEWQNSTDQPESLGISRNE